MSHDEFKKYTTKLSKEIDTYCTENKFRIDYIVPILRSGAVPAVYIANDLNIIKFAPIQVKKMKKDGKKLHIVLMNTLKDLDKNKAYNLLMVEGIFTSGETTKTALAEIVKTLPNAKILFTCVCVRGKDNLPKNVQASFYGFDSPKEKLFVFPWENVDQKETHPDQLEENIFF